MRTSRSGRARDGQAAAADVQGLLLERAGLVDVSLQHLNDSGQPSSLASQRTVAQLHRRNEVTNQGKLTDFGRLPAVEDTVRPTKKDPQEHALAFERRQTCGPCAPRWSTPHIQVQSNLGSTTQRCSVGGGGTLCLKRPAFGGSPSLQIEGGGLEELNEQLARRRRRTAQSICCNKWTEAFDSPL